MQSLITSGAVFLFISASSTGVVPIGKDTYMVSMQAATGFSGSGKLKSKVFKEATEYCKKLNKNLQVVSTWEASPPYILANFPKAEITFMCLDTSDPEYMRPKLKTEADTSIEVNINGAEQIGKGATSKPDLYSELIKLEDLKKRGLISDSEFEVLKQKLLNDIK